MRFYSRKYGWMTAVPHFLFLKQIYWFLWRHTVFAQHQHYQYWERVFIINRLHIQEWQCHTDWAKTYVETFVWEGKDTSFINIYRIMLLHRVLNTRVERLLNYVKSFKNDWKLFKFNSSWILAYSNESPLSNQLL